MSKLNNSKNTIVVKLMGGLGNQLFQYFAGLSLAKRHNARLICDTGFYKGNNHRALKLPQLGIETEYTRTNNLFNNILSRLKFFKWVFCKGHVLNRVVYDGMPYWPEFKTIDANSYLWGYWQSEQYFSDIEQDVVHAIQPSEDIKKLIDKNIDHSCFNVGVHVRRGDYAQISDYPLMGERYYNVARSKILEKYPDAFFNVFSDDIKETKKLFSDWDNVKFFDESKSDIEDFFYLTQCQAHIIANSTFSWWAAWLAEKGMIDNHSGLVYAPKNWFSAERLAKDGIDDLIPQQWNLIDGK